MDVTEEGDGSGPAPAWDTPVTVMVVDDHAVVRQGIRHLLEAADLPLHIVAEVGSVAEAHEALVQDHPDVAIVDVVLPDGDGIQLCREIVSASPGTSCLILTSFPDEQAVMAAIFAGAAGYLVKNAREIDLVSAIMTVAAGGSLLDADDVAQVLDETAERLTGGGHLDELTAQERRVFLLIGQGLSNREIASELHLTEKTVKNYVSRMLAKLHLDRRTEAAVLSARLAERRARQRGHHPRPS